MSAGATLIEIFPYNFWYPQYFGTLATEVGVSYVPLMDPAPRMPCMESIDATIDDGGKCDVVAARGVPTRYDVQLSCPGIAQRTVKQKMKKLHEIWENNEKKWSKSLI